MKPSQIIRNIITPESIQKIKRIILIIFNIIGLNELFRLKNRKKLIIISYHGITKHTYNANPYHIPKSTFLEQIYYLLKKNYKFISLTDWAENVKSNKKVKHGYVILTFDDGFKGVINNAYPYMKKLDIKGCFYLISDLIGKDHFLWADYIDTFIRNYKNNEFVFHYKNKLIRYSLYSEKQIQYAISDIINKLNSIDKFERLFYSKQFNRTTQITNFDKIQKDILIANWTEIKFLDKSIIEIGSHTKTHPYLGKLSSEDKLYQELYESKIKIEKELKYSVKHLAYPHGSYNEKTIKQAKLYGYLTGVTINRGLNSSTTDLFQLKRIMGYKDYLLFKTNISGLFPFLIDLLKKFK